MKIFATIEMFTIKKHDCKKSIEKLSRFIQLTDNMAGSRLRSMGLMTMKTCWFLCVSPPASLRAARQKYCTQPCLPRKVEGRPLGRPSLKGKLWMPGESEMGSWSVESFLSSNFFYKSHNIYFV